MTPDSDKQWHALGGMLVIDPAAWLPTLRGLGQRAKQARGQALVAGDVAAQQVQRRLAHAGGVVLQRRRGSRASGAESETGRFKR